jgi:hypothetical protein
MNAVKLQLSTGLPPKQLTMSVVKLEGGPAASMKPGQKSCVRSSEIITLSAQWPNDGSGKKPTSDEATMINHKGVTNVARPVVGKVTVTPSQSYITSYFLE